MAQSFTIILSHQRELTAAARRFTGDINEAALLVGRVVSRALGKGSVSGSAAEIAREMRRDLERLLAEDRQAGRSPRPSGSGSASPSATNDSDTELMQ